MSSGSCSPDLLPGLSIVIPCLNEEGTLGAAVAEAFLGITQSGVAGEVIVADNGSTDRSVAVGIQAGARVVQVPERGYGSALRAGMADARYGFVAFADADLSYSFLDIPRLMEPLRDGRADFVLGSRLSGGIDPGAMRWLNRRLGTPLLSWLIRALYGIKVSDCNSGMRALRTDLLFRLRLNCPGMEFASEMLIRCAQERLRYAEIPITLRMDRRNRRSHLRPWVDGARHFRVIIGRCGQLDTREAM